MRNRMKNSLNIKVFFLVFTALTICSILIYCIVMTVLPKQYQFTEDRQLNANAEAFVSELSGMSYEDGIRAIYDFCIRNHSAAVLLGDNRTLAFGELRSDKETAATSSIAVYVGFSDSQVKYTLVISSAMRAADRISGLLVRFLPVVFLIIIFLSVLSALICSRIIVSPIARISEISKRMASPDMTWRCDVTSGDEIGMLASNLNTMASRLQAAMEELELANRQLAADVRKFHALDEQRRHFFAAVSHELKTPLTILRGQIENMILGYGDYQDHEKYLPETLSAVDNMERLVKEIIGITKMESMDLQDTLQDISLLESIHDTTDTILPLAEEKSIHIQADIDRDITVKVNPSLWNKVMSNVIGNAVRHSPKGETVFISLQTEERGYVLCVENTGVSIPGAELQNMFVPFYRGDKSRSKATGGSGLGLYIVKIILDLHNFSYRIENTRRGVAFLIDLTSAG